MPKDDRDFQLGAFTKLPDLNELPETYRLPFTVKDQTTTDWCTAYATCATSEVQEGVLLEPAYSFAVTKHIQGNMDSWGADLRSAAKAHVKFGALPTEVVATTTKELSLAEQRDYTNWERYDPLAHSYRKQSYFQVTGQYDVFDNIRATIHKYQTPVFTGIEFGYSIKTILLDKITSGYGHAMAIIGWTKFDDGQDVLIIGNSYGTKAGDSGVHYITREVINHWAGRYGAFTFIDTAPFDVRAGIKETDNWFIRLCKTILYYVL